MFNVMLVEDDYIIRMGIKKIIDEMDCPFTVTGEASNGKDAVKLLEGDALFHVIISDVKMPHMNGIELAEYVASNYPDIRLIVLSGYSNYEYVRTCLRNGAVDYLLKPVDKNELHDLLSSIADKISPVNFYNNSKSYTDVFDFTAILNKHIDGTIASIGKNDQDKIISNLSSIRELLFNSSVKPEIARSLYIKLYNAYENLYIGLSDSKINNSSYSKAINSFTTIDEIHNYCVNCFCTLSKILADTPKSSAIGKVLEVKKFINENYKKQITLAMLSKVVYTSPSYISTQFKLITGCNIIDYMHTVRINHACALLYDTSLKTYEISEAVGYSDSNYFSRTFKHITGVSPIEYRKNIHHNETAQ